MMQVVWHGELAWGNESYRHLLSGMVYRRARRRETPDLVEVTKFGLVSLRKLNRKEMGSFSEMVGRPKRQGRRKKS